MLGVLKECWTECDEVRGEDVVDDEREHVVQRGMLWVLMGELHSGVCLLVLQLDQSVVSVELEEWMMMMMANPRNEIRKPQ